MATEKAYLEIEGGERVPCMFNPAQLQISKSNSWAGETRAGRAAPTLRFLGSESGVLSLDLFFDTTARGTAVTAYTGKILGLMEVDPSLPGSDEGSQNLRPRHVTFHWGDLHAFKAVLTNVVLTFTYFSSAGVPLRAHMSLQLMQYEPSNAFGPQNPTSGTPRPQRTHRVQAGETLDRIAAQYYGDSTRWRSLAEANAITDPLALRPGTVIAIPRLD